MGSQSKITHSQYISSRKHWGHFMILNFRSSLQRGKRLQIRRGAATLARKRAFLELQQVSRQAEEVGRTNRIRRVQGVPPLPMPDVSHYLERYRAAVENQRAVRKETLP